ncbi:MAG: gliding motility-associated C-terminal domain-containing protein [Flavobacteriales bacterium]
MLRFCTILAILITGRLCAQCGACKYETDLVVNGDFSSGNTGFSSGLDYVTGIFTCPLCPENTYTIGANAIFYHSDFIGSDHTNPPTGNFFIANGPGQSGSEVWCQTIAVQPNTDYVFTFWAQDITNNNNPHPTALLQASFNGLMSADTLDADGDWEALVVNWNSGNATALDLCIINQQSQTGGNDFGLDDISLVGCHDYHLAHQPIAGADTTVCSNEIVLLGSSSFSGYNYSWNNPVGISSTTISNPVFSLSNTSGSPITLEYILTTDSAGVGCVQSDTILVTVLSMPDFTLGTDITICPGETTSIYAGNSWDSVLWSNNSVSSQIEVGVGVYSAEVTFGLCSSQDQVEVLEQNMPVIDLGDDQEICETNPVTLDAGIVGLWSTGETAASIIADETGDYSFTFSSGNCSVEDQVTITVFSMPVISLPSDSLFCEGQTIVLDAGVEGLWSNGQTASSIAITEQGYYSITVSNGPCIATEGTLATKLLLPYASLPEDTLICNGTYLTVDSEADQNDEYLWSTGDTTSSLTLNTAGVYEITVSNECGVANSEIYVETYLCGWDIFIPNSFTPNEDGINEGWHISSFNVSNIKIYIYNRLGDLIFYTTNQDEAWLPSTGVGDDVYNYRVEAITFENESITRLGHIYLLR